MKVSSRIIIIHILDHFQRATTLKSFNFCQLYHLNLNNNCWHWRYIFFLVFITNKSSYKFLCFIYIQNKALNKMFCNILCNTLYKVQN